MAHKRPQRPRIAGTGGVARKGHPGISSGVKSQAERVLRTGQRFDKFDQIRVRHFWSAYYFDTSVTDTLVAGRFTLFTTPVGNNGQGFPSGQVITERESNWKSQNRVPDNQNFEITELGLGVMPVDFGTNLANPYVQRYQTPTALSNFFNSAILSITYLTNSVPLGLLCDFAQASGPAMGVGVFPANTPVNPINSAYTNGFAAPALRRKFKIPILLQHGESFNFTIELPRNTYVGQATTGQLGAPFLIRMDFWATESFVEKS